MEEKAEDNDGFAVPTVRQEAALTQCATMQADDLDAWMGASEPSDSGAKEEVWGRLVSLNPLHDSIDLVASKTDLGRGHCCAAECRFPDAKVSKLHCSVLRLRGSDGRHTTKVVDNSANGTFISGRRLSKGAPTALESGEELSLVELKERKSSEEVRLEVNSGFFQKLLALEMRAEAVKRPDTDPGPSSSLAECEREGKAERNAGRKRKRGEELLKSAPAALSASSLQPMRRAASHTFGSQQRLAKRRKRAPSQYFEVDTVDLLLNSTRVVMGVEEHHSGRYKLVRLRRPALSDMSYAASEFKKAELAFRRFVNKDISYEVTGVDVVVNDELEERYRLKVAQLRHHQEAEVDFLGPWAADAVQGRAMRQLCADLEQSTAAVDAQSTTVRNRGDTALLAWHGASEEKIRSICEKGFQLTSGGDEGWYGKGIYLTQMPCYGEFYIDQVQEGVENAQLLLSWAALGKPYPCKDYSHYGAACMEGFDSHYALVKKFRLCKAEEEPNGDELVLFDPAQVLPRYIVRYKCTPRAPFDADAPLQPQEAAGNTSLQAGASVDCTGAREAVAQSLFGAPADDVQMEEREMVHEGKETVANEREMAVDGSETVEEASETANQHGAGVAKCELPPEALAEIAKSQDNPDQEPASEQSPEQSEQASWCTVC